MFDFMDEDWFIIALEIVFLLFIGYDLKKYFQTKKREFLLNIAMAVGFFIYAAIPFYHKYMGWSEQQRADYMKTCAAAECDCVSDKLFKEYSYETYTFLQMQRDDALKSFMSDVQTECANGDAV